MDRLTLKPGHWYAWQMMPGYTDIPYYSPIRVDHCEALGTGQSKLRLAYFNAAYAAGVQNFEEPLRVLIRERDYMIAVRDEGKSIGEIRTAIISNISWDWMKLHFNGLVDAKSRKNAEAYSDSLFAFLDRAYLG